jgi:small-conductance mechanosensitive channel
MARPRPLLRLRELDERTGVGPLTRTVIALAAPLYLMVTVVLAATALTLAIRGHWVGALFVTGLTLLAATWTWLGWRQRRIADQR